MHKVISRLAALAVFVIGPVALAQKSPGASYHVVKKIAVGGEGGWDLLIADTANDRLYVSRGTHVTVVDLLKDSVIGDIANTPGVHGIAIASSLNRGFTSNGRDTSVTIFDLRTLAPISTVKVTGPNPDAILFDPFSGRVFSFNARGNNATAIDAASGKVVGTIAFDGNPELPVTDGKGTVYVNIENKSEIVAFDPRTLTVRNTWPLAPCEEPTGLALDGSHGRLFSMCGNKLMAVVDASSGKVITAVSATNDADPSLATDARSASLPTNVSLSDDTAHESPSFWG